MRVRASTVLARIGMCGGLRRDREGRMQRRWKSECGKVGPMVHSADAARSGQKRLACQGVLLLLTAAAVSLSSAGAAGATATVTTPPATSPAATTSAAPAAGSSAIPVLGSTVITAGRKADGTRVAALVHGVRRIPGGTVLYFSVGIPAGSADVPWGDITNGRSQQSYPGTALGNQQLIDLAGNRSYSVLVGADEKLLASPAEAWPGTAGAFYVLYQVLPELPAGLATVDVMIGNNDVVHDVPVSDGLLEPAVAQTAPLKLGTGWPQIDPAAVTGAVKPLASIRPLHSKTSDLEKTVVQRSTDDSVSVDLSADVLFAVDSATLSAAATSKIQVAADKINSGAAAGKVEVIGYTDNTGSTAHNADLSKRRAAAVAKVLKPLVTLSGVTFATDGRGEREPVADNTTSAGRQENRRVSVVFTPKGAK